MSEADQEATPTARWMSVDPWLRFALISFATLIVAAFLPSWRIPGPTSGSTTSTATTQRESQSSFDFDPVQFLDRWNAIDLGDPNLESALAADGYASVQSTTSSFRVEHQDGVDWTVLVFSELENGHVTEIELIAPLDTSFDLNSFGAILVIASVEETSFADAETVWLSLIDRVDPEQDVGEPVSIEWTTSDATYRLSLSVEVQFLFEALP